MVKDVEFRSLLTIKGCKNRIVNAADEDLWHSWLTNIYGKEIGYKLDGNKLRLRKARPYRRNSFQVSFVGNFISSHNMGTLIKGKFVMNRFGLVFFIIWETLVVTVAVGTLIGLLANKFTPASKGAEFLSGIMIVFLLPIFGLGIFLYGKKVAERDKQIIGKFIKETCLAA